MKLADPRWIAVKAGIAASLAVVASRALRVDDALSAGFVGLACVSPSAYAGLRNGLGQLAGSAIACALAGAPIALAPASRGSAWAIFPALVASVYACFALRLSSAYLVAGFSVLYLHLLPFTSAASGISVRIEAVAIGLVAATVVNTLVSALFARRVTARRVEVAKRLVARELVHAATWIAEPHGTAPPDFEAAFDVVRELRGDLGAAARERLFPGAARARQSAARGLKLAGALERATHLAKEITSLVEASAGEPVRRAHARAALAAAAEGLSGGRAVSRSAPADLDPALGAVLTRLAESVEEGR